MVRIVVRWLLNIEFWDRYIFQNKERFLTYGGGSRSSTLKAEKFKKKDLT